MSKHSFAKGKLFECIGVKIGIYSLHGEYVKDIRKKKKNAGVHLDGSIERAWSRLAMMDAMKPYNASWDVMILATTNDKDLENEIAIAISSEYFADGNTGVLVSLFLDGIRQANKELRAIAHLYHWA
jgi:hypothetical protein